MFNYKGEAWKTPIFQLHMNAAGVESSAEPTAGVAADDLDTCLRGARDSAQGAEPIQI